MFNFERIVVKKFGNVKLTCSSDSVSATRKKIFGEEIVFKFHFKYLNDFENIKEEIESTLEDNLEALSCASEGKSNQDTLAACKFLLSLIENQSYWLLISEDKNNQHSVISYILSDHYRETKFHSYFISEKPSVDKSVINWKTEKLLEKLTDINDYEFVFKENKKGESIFAQILHQGLNKVSDLLFEKDEFIRYKKRLAESGIQGTSPIKNPIMALLQDPYYFNKNIFRFGDLSKYHIRNEHYINKDINIFECIFSNSMIDLRDFDLSLFDGLGFFNYKNLSKEELCENDQPIYNRFIFNNISYFREKDRCVENLKLFFATLNDRDIKINLDIAHNHKLLLEYAMEEFNIEMVRILIENGASQNALVLNQYDEQVEFLNDFNRKGLFYKQCGEIIN